MFFESALSGNVVRKFWTQTGLATAPPKVLEKKTDICILDSFQPSWVVRTLVPALTWLDLDPLCGAVTQFAHRKWNAKTMWLQATHSAQKFLKIWLSANALQLFPRNNLWCGFYATLELPALEFVGVATFLGSGVVLVPFGSLHVRCTKLGHKKKTHPNLPTSIWPNHASVRICLDCLGFTLVYFVITCNGTRQKHLFWVIELLWTVTFTSGQGRSGLHAKGGPAPKPENMYTTSIYMRHKSTNKSRCEFHRMLAQATFSQCRRFAYREYASNFDSHVFRGRPTRRVPKGCQESKGWTHWGAG